MFARVIEIKTRTGKAKEVTERVHEKIFSTLKAQPGFVDELVLVSDQEGILAVSFWKTQADAERFNREHYKDVHDLIKDLLHAEPTVHTYDVETSTVHRISKGRAA